MPNRLEFHRILLTSPARDYEVSLGAGVNVIAGPISTGKSSVLEILNYACGKKSPLKYPEIKKCSEALVEMSVNGTRFTMQRSLRNSSAHAQISLGTISDIKRNKKVESFELLVTPNPQSDAPSISSELLNRLGIGAIKIKNAPKQDASDTNAFSIRDLFSLLFVDQNRMGISPGFFENIPSKAIKWRPAFEIVHGLYDEQLALLAKALSESQKEQEKLRSSLVAAQEFLTEMNVPDIETAEKQLRELQSVEGKLNERIAAHKASAVERLGEHFELMTKRDAVFLEVRNNQSSQEELTKTLTQLGRLQVQYEREQRQLQFLIESNTLISKIPITKCPSCFQKISSDKKAEKTCYLCHQNLLERDDIKGVDKQLRALNLRVKDLDSYVAELDVEKSTREKRKTALLRVLDETDDSIAQIKQASVFPKDEALLQLTHLLSDARNSMARLREYMAFRKKAQGEGSNLLNLEQRINDLKARQEAQKAERPKSDDVIAELSVAFVDKLKNFQFPYALDNAYIDGQSYLPIVRGQLYTEIRSNGAIALIQCAWHFAVLEYALKHEQSLYPRCLFLDSPLNHIGKNSKDPMFRDQRIVDGFLAYLRQLHNENKDKFQIFICYNESGTLFGDMLAESFTGLPGEGRFGLIDDEHTELDRSPLLLPGLGEDQPSS